MSVSLNQQCHANRQCRVGMAIDRRPALRNSLIVETRAD